MRKKAILILFIIMLYLPARLLAQTDLGGDDVNDVPFDGGVSLLVAAGLAYGLKKVNDHRKQKNYKKD